MATENLVIFAGSWKHDRSENLEKYLDAADVGYLKKKVVMNLNPTLTIKVNGENLEVATAAGPKTVTNAFKLGEEFKFDGEIQAMAKASFSDGKLRIDLTPTDSKKKSQTIFREVINDELIQTMHIGDTEAKRIFKKVQ